MTAPIPPPAAAASPGPPASPGAAAPGPASAQRLGRRRDQPAPARLTDAIPEPAAPATAITPRSLERSAPRRARRLAGRAGSRHRHPLPDVQDNKTEHTAQGVCPHPPQTLELRVSQADVPCGPGTLPAARPAGSITAPGTLAHHAGPARAGAPLTTSQHHHDGRAAPAVTLWHRENPGRPRSACAQSAGSPPEPGLSGGRMPSHPPPAQPEADAVTELKLTTAGPSGGAASAQLL
jgi:hypothetical protein